MKKENSYIISIVFLFLITFIIGSTIIQARREIYQIPSIEINGDFDNKGIYEYLQLYYSCYKNDPILRIEADKANSLEIYVAGNPSNSGQVDYIYYCNTNKKMGITFNHYREEQLIETYSIDKMIEKANVIAFQNIAINDEIEIIFVVNGKEYIDKIETNYYLSNGLIKK